MNYYKLQTHLFLLQTAQAQRREAEQERQKSEEKFRIFFENAPDYCYMISPEGTILDVNSSALNTLGYTKDELVGKLLKTIYAPESFPKMQRVFAEWKRAGRVKNEELVISTKNGEKRTVILSAEAMRGEDGRILHSISIQKDITERKRIEAELDRSYKKLRGLSAHLLNLREEERRRIAHAIHDDLGQSLMILDMNLYRLCQKIPSSQKPLQAMTKSLMAQVKRIAETVQRISAELRPKLLDDVGLIPALKWKVKKENQPR